MSHLSYIKRLYKFNDWANKESLKSVQASPRKPAPTLKRLAHILAAEHVWFQRLRNEPILVPVWPAWTLDEIAVQLDQMREGWESYLDGLSDQDLSGTIKYANTAGLSYESRRDDILHHVVTHGAHHRGQIASDLRASGDPPAVTDLIFGLRDDLV